MKGRHQGFTLVELIVVIVILGILAATALPRFINVTNEARVAAINGVAGGLRSAVALVQAAWQAQGQPTSQVVMSGGTNVSVNANGFPTTADSTGIVAAMGCTSSPCQGVTVGGNGATWTPQNAGTCSVTYAPLAGTVTASLGGAAQNCSD